MLPCSMVSLVCCEVDPRPPPPAALEQAPGKDFERAAALQAEGVRRSGQAADETQGLGRAGEMYFLSSVQPGDWMKAADVAAALERWRSDREVCRAAANAAERVAAHERGLDALVEHAAVQQLVDSWHAHRNDTALAVHVNNVVARFWERAGSDAQWFLLPTSLAAGKALMADGRQEWLFEAHRTAVRLHASGLAAAAMDIYRIAVERFEKQLGPTDQMTLQAQNNLAVLLEEHGDPEEAGRLHLEVCERLEAKQGTDHPDTLSSKFNQAALKAKQGRTQEAEALFRQVSELRERVLGAQHADTLRAKACLAGLLRKQGRLPEAEHLLRAVVDQSHAAFGRDSASTLKSRCQLAQVFSQQGDPLQVRQAEAHLREVVARREQMLGQVHPDTLRALGQLSFLLEERRPEEAVALNERIWQCLDIAAPPERRRTGSRQGSFVAGLEQTGEPQRAEAMLRQVAERRRSALGASHPDALAAQAELAALLARRGNEAAVEALTLQRWVAEASETALGPEHVDTLVARTALAASLIRQAAADGTDSKAARAEAEALHHETLRRFSAVAASAAAPGLTAAAESSGTRSAQIGNGGSGKHVVLTRE